MLRATDDSDGIEWDSPQLSGLPRIVRDRPHWPNFQFARCLPKYSPESAERKDGPAKREGKESCAEADEEDGYGQMESIAYWGAPSSAPLVGGKMDEE